MTEPPVCPKGSEVFLYKSNYEDPWKFDFQFDQYRWRNKGCRSFATETCTIIKTYYYLVDVNGTLNKSFKKNVCVLVENPMYFLLHYVGDEKLYTLRPRGNAHETKKPFVPSKKSVFKNIKESKCRTAMNIEICRK
ncbi:Uncharacterised protein at_DN2013 [Pycnogonum litorale]